MAAAIFIGVAGHGLAAATGDLVVPQADPADSDDLQLEVFVNQISTKLVAAVRKEAGGSYTMDPIELRNVGIRPLAAARRRDGRIDLRHLPKLSFVVDQAGQKLLFTAPEAARAPKLISARRGVDPRDASDPRNRIQSGHGALLNYAVNASGLYGFDNSRFDYGGISGTFDGRMFSPAGVLDNSMSVVGSDVRRLDSSYSYSDPQSLRSFHAGDIITGGLSWTRPSRLAGLQIQSNFALRPGLVTIPIPGFTSSAAVPSTVDVFLDNSRRFSQQVPAGPFEVTDMPVVTGAGTAKLVVRDEKGNETVTESDYFVSDRLLRPGLIDYSLDVGVPRTGYGTDFDHYDLQPFASGSLRYGLSDRLTVEGHAEGGSGLVNAGAGLVGGLGRWGVGSFAASASTAGANRGFQLSGSLELDFGGPRLQSRIQRSFGDYDDIASVSQRASPEDDLSVLSGGTLRALDQVSLSLPVLDLSYLNVSYTQLRSDTDRSRLASLSYGRPLFGGTLTASGFASLSDSDYGIFASFSIPIGATMTASTSAQADGSHVSLYNTLSRPASDDNGNFGWQLQHQEGDQSALAVNGDIKAPNAKIGATIHQAGDTGWGSARISGAVVAADGHIFLSDRVNDAFAVVDTGSPDVGVLRENRPLGKTDSHGLLLVPDLRSYERNTIGIDPNGLPLDTAIDSTKQIVVPADRAGVIVHFGRRDKGGTALVSFRTEDGAAPPVGTTGLLNGQGEAFIVGYDGEAFLSGLDRHNRVTLQDPTGKACIATFDFTPNAGVQVVISDVPCNSH